MVRNYKRKTEDRWSKQDLLLALTAIKTGEIKLRDVPGRFGMSRATVYRHYNRFLQANGNSTYFFDTKGKGGRPILERIEENVFATTIMNLRNSGNAVNPTNIKQICFEYCDANRIPNKFNRNKRMASDDWYYGFLKRHPELKVPIESQNPKTKSPQSGSNPTKSKSSKDGRCNKGTLRSHGMDEEEAPSSVFVIPIDSSQPQKRRINDEEEENMRNGKRSKDERSSSFEVEDKVVGSEVDVINDSDEEDSGGDDERIKM